MTRKDYLDVLVSEFKMTGLSRKSLEELKLIYEEVVNKNDLENSTEILLIEYLGNKTSRICKLYKEGYSISKIKDILQIRYQHVYNTLKRKNYIESNEVVSIEIE